jgi:hypothetical protein
MSHQATGALLALLLLTGCGAEGAGRSADTPSRVPLSPDLRDAETLGVEVFELVDRAVDYRGSHRGRPASTIHQMGIDSLTDLTVRRLINFEREPVVTAAFRRPETHEITSCRGDSQILEEAAVSGGHYTLMCTTRSGTQRPIRVGGSAADR